MVEPYNNVALIKKIKYKTTPLMRPLPIEADAAYYFLRYANTRQRGLDIMENAILCVARKYGFICGMSVVRYSLGSRMFPD